MDIPEGFLAVLAAILGLIFGSFGTVVAYRLPKGETVVSGRSKCPNCGHTITAIENIPLFSYLFLRGRCRNCGVKISVRYPAIEVVTGILFALAVIKFDLTIEAFVYAGLFWTLVVLAVIDLEEKKLPDKITLPLFVVGLGALALAAFLDDRVGDLAPDVIVSAAVILVVMAVMFPWRAADRRPDAQTPPAGEEDVEPTRPKRIRINPWGLSALVAWMVLLGAAFLEGERVSLAGAVVGAGLFAGFFFAVALTAMGGMGGGDVKLALTLGAFSGYLGAPGTVIVAMFAAVVLGGLVSIIVLFGGGTRKTALPFGPFLALGTVVAIFVGDRIQDLYGSTL
ncbi:MAG: prepilin peptidase [Actinomycetota bacterium]|nr:prepilin peptidase [Actinomycetota bacterium]